MPKFVHWSPNHRILQLSHLVFIRRIIAIWEQRKNLSAMRWFSSFLRFGYNIITFLHRSAMLTDHLLVGAAMRTSPRRNTFSYTQNYEKSIINVCFCWDGCQTRALLVDFVIGPKPTVSCWPSRIREARPNEFMVNNQGTTGSPFRHVRYPWNEQGKGLMHFIQRDPTIRSRCSSSSGSW